MKTPLQKLIPTLTFILLLFSSTLSLTAQVGAIKGVVTDATTGELVPFANIAIATDFGTRGAQTDFDGFYHIKPMPVDTYTVVVSFVGYETQNIENVIIIANETTDLNVALQARTEILGVMEVKSYGTTPSPPPPTAVYDRSISKRSKKSRAAATATVIEKDSYGIHIAPEVAPITAGQLTAGEIHDFSKWTLWQDIASETLKRWQYYWGIRPVERYMVQLMTEDGQAIVDQEVFLQNKQGKVLWTSRTDNTGKAELWAHLFEEGTSNKKVNLTITTIYNGQEYRRKKAKTFAKGKNTIRIPMACQQTAWADIAFVVDATGSMGDEIEYLKVELNDVIQKIKEKQQGLTLNLGSVFYRDEYEKYVTKKSDFSTDPQQTIEFIQQQRAAGGGDTPEAVHSALEVAIRELEWSQKATARLLFLVLDAPPHYKPEVLESLQQLTQEAAKKGIRIIPVTASGIDKDTEYLMRSMALATNGTYVFLTDDSGIGNPHLKPTTDEYKVETFNELLIRLVGQYTEMPDCSEKVVLNEEQKTNFGAEISPLLKYYPNPTIGPVTVDVFEDMPELYLTDLTGKLLQRFTNVKQGTLNLDLSNFPSGIYLIRYPKTENRWLSGKIVVTR